MTIRNILCIRFTYTNLLYLQLYICDCKITRSSCVYKRARYIYIYIYMYIYDFWLVVPTSW